MVSEIPRAIAFPFFFLLKDFLGFKDSDGLNTLVPKYFFFLLSLVAKFDSTSCSSFKALYSHTGCPAGPVTQGS